jgi:hypothetical protein
MAVRTAKGRAVYRKAWADAHPHQPFVEARAKTRPGAPNSPETGTTNGLRAQPACSTLAILSALLTIKDDPMTRLPLLLAASLFALNASALELAKYPQVFDAGKGISVTVAPSSDGKQALLQVSGINHPLDEVVLLTTIKERGNDELSYSTTLNGSASSMLVKRQGWGGERFQLYLPDTEGFELGFDETKSKAAKPAALLALYEQQKKQGIQDKLSRFDREQRVADFSTQLQQIDQDASKSCGTPLTTAVDWQAIEDDKLQRLGVPSFCGEVVRQMASLCENNAAFKAQAEQLKTVQCSFDAQLKLREGDAGLVFTTHEKAPNQGDFINAYLRNR